MNQKMQLNISADRLIDETIRVYGAYPKGQIYREAISKHLEEIKPEAFGILYQHAKGLSEPDKSILFYLAFHHHLILNSPQKLKTFSSEKLHLNINAKDLERCLSIITAAKRCWDVLNSELIGNSKKILKTKNYIWQACFGRDLLFAFKYEKIIRDQNVLILGETGTGKELVAKALMTSVFWYMPENGKLKESDLFHSINVAAIAESLVDSELFGSEKGSFTDSDKSRTGIIREADKRALFLDELGELPILTQSKLLRTIDTKLVRPVGSAEEKSANVRYISATNKDILSANFRNDLFERLAGYVITIPVLKDRREDIYLIVDKIILDYGVVDKKVRDDAKTFIDDLSTQNYSWPGNVRELKSAIRGIILGLFTADNYKDRFSYQLSGTKEIVKTVPNDILNCKWSKKRLEEWYIDRVMDLVNGNKEAAARILGIHSTTLRYRLKENE